MGLMGLFFIAQAVYMQGVLNDMEKQKKLAENQEQKAAWKTFNSLFLQFLIDKRHKSPHYAPFKNNGKTPH